MTSSAPLAITSLLALIAAQSVCQSVDNFTFGIQQGEPIANWSVDDGIFIAQVNRQVMRAEMRGLTAGGMKEDFTLVVSIGAFRGGDTASVVEGRVWDLINAVENAVITNRNLNSSVLDAWPESSSVTSTWDDEDQGRRANATVSVHCTQFI